MVSRRVSRAAVAEWRRRSISSLIDESFSMYVSLDGDVRLGLVVVVVADEVLDPVVGEELPHLLGELGGEALVRSEDQRRLLRLLDRPGDGRRLAGPGDAEQRLEAIAAHDALAQLGDRLGLVAGRREVGHDPERLLLHPTSVAPNNRSVPCRWTGDPGRRGPAAIGFRRPIAVDRPPPAMAPPASAPPATP